MFKQKGRLLLGVLVVLFLGSRGYYYFTDDFRHGNILVGEEVREEWEIPPLSPRKQLELKKILTQEYTYLGKGAQSYAFVSEDGRYVFKLFKSKHFKPNRLLKWIPFQEPFEKNLARREARKTSTLNGYKLAYDQHKEPSALLFIHLNPTQNAMGTLQVRDKLGVHRTIDLDRSIFVVQEKGEKLRNVIRPLMDQGDLVASKEKIRQVLDLYLSEYQKGVYDRDHGVMHNIGFVGDKVIHLDLGKFDYNPLMRDPEVFLEDLHKVILKIHTFFKNEYPEHLDAIVRDIEEHLSGRLGISHSLPS